VLDEYDYTFRLGRAAALRGGRDVLFVSTGLMTVRALSAARELERDHVDAAVLHVPTIKPFDREAVVREAAKDRLVVTLENHSVIGGLAESVASSLAFARVTSRLVPRGSAGRVPRGGRAADAARPVRPVGGGDQGPRPP
jgi:transketolase